MEKTKILEWAKRNRVVAGLLLLFLGAFVFILTSMILGSFIYKQETSYDFQPVGDSSIQMSASPSLDSSFEFDFGFSDYFGSKTESRTLSTELEIREGSIKVKSEDAENDFEVLKGMLEQEEGYIETSRKNEGKTQLSFSTSVRIPVENFEDFVEKVQNTFEIENFQLSNYKIEIQRQMDELEIINRALFDYDLIREETLSLENDTERIELLSRITQEMQYLASQKRTLERDLGGSTKQSDFATISITFTEKLKPDLWPEDLGHYFYNEINWAIESAAMISLSLLGNSLVLLIKVVEYIVYAAVIILPVSFVWNLIKKIRSSKKSD